MQLIGCRTAPASKAIVTPAPAGRYFANAHAIAAPSCTQKYSQRARRKSGARSGFDCNLGDDRRNLRRSRVSTGKGEAIDSFALALVSFFPEDDCRIVYYLENSLQHADNGAVGAVYPLFNRRKP